MVNKKDTKLTSFHAVCPDCERVNFFAVVNEEMENDYHFACDYCKKEYPLSEYRQVEMLMKRVYKTFEETDAKIEDIAMWVLGDDGLVDEVIYRFKCWEDEELMKKFIKEFGGKDNAQNPDRQKAIKILELVEDFNSNDRYEGLSWYHLEDKITRIIRRSKY